MSGERIRIDLIRSRKPRQKKRRSKSEKRQKRQGEQMSAATNPTHGVMEGGGSYNLHAKIPAGGGNLALPYLEKAAWSCTLRSGSDPIVIADYGSSQGKNSLAPMRAAIRCLRTRVGNERAVVVIHVDQHANDFNTLFDVLHSDPDRYSTDDPSVFPSAIGRSFYENVFPREQVDLAWCSYAAVWLNRVPALIPGHFMSLASTGDVRAAFDRQAADDWRLFLALRAQELRPGGRLLVVLPGLSDAGASGFEPLFNCANAVLAQLVHEQVIGDDERKRMVLGAYPRRRAQLLEPFNADGQFQALSVERCELLDLPDAAWADYQRDRNVDALVSRHAAFFRAIFVPSLASAVGDAGRREAFADSLEQKLKQRLCEHPTPFHSFVQVMVLAKQGPSVTPSLRSDA
jgi:SAM dependent carboxyl methyltransferase